jgi:hypothetical protein
MSKRRLCKRALVGACVALLGACSDSGDGSGDGSTANAAGAAGAGSGDEMAECAADYLAFSTGDEGGLRVPVKDTAYEVRLLGANHEPPKKDYNSWTIGVRDAATGAPVPNATISWACAWMNVHQHGTNPKGFVSKGNGDFELVDQNLSMFGPWEVRFWVDPTGAAPMYDPQMGSTQRNGKACTPSTGPQVEYNTEFRVCVPRSIAN